MILLTHDTPILLCIAPSDFRKGIDGFAALCRLQLAQDPANGTVYLFINRSRTMIRALTYDGSGYWIITKRISRGKFQSWPSGQELMSTASARELRMIMGGNETGTQQSVNNHSRNAAYSTTINRTKISTTMPYPR